MLKQEKRSISLSMPENVQETSSRWFFCILLYIFVDYGRPQDLLPIGFLRPGMLTILLLTWFLISNSKSLKEADSKQTRYIFAFTCLLAFLVPFAKNNFFAFTTTKTMLLYLPFILSTIIVVNSIERLRKLVDFIILTMCYVTLYCLTHKGRGSGNYFTDENDIALYINTVLPFCYFLFIYEKNNKKKIWYMLAMSLGVFGVVKSFSRGGFLGLIAMITVAWLHSQKKIVTIIIIIMLGMSAYYYGGERYKAEMATSTDAEHGTGKQRIEFWKTAWRIFLDNPFGVGGNNYQVRNVEYQTKYFKKGLWGIVAHSLWFTLIPETGIIGIYIYLMLLFYNLKDIFWLKKKTSNSRMNEDYDYIYHITLSFIASFAGFFVSASFLSVLYYPHYWYLTAILVSAKKITVNLNFHSQEHS